jgi:hypothetical protein
MTIARAHRVVPSVTCSNHSVTRCVRRAFLIGDGLNDRSGYEWPDRLATARAVVAAQWPLEVANALLVDNIHGPRVGGRSEMVHFLISAAWTSR